VLELTLLYQRAICMPAQFFLNYILRKVEISLARSIDIYKTLLLSSCMKAQQSVSVHSKNYE
jgi:hypothetical protein